MRSDQNQGESIESRWGPIIVVLAVTGILELMPFRLRVYPIWATYFGDLLLVVPMLGTQLSGARPAWLRAETTAVILFICAAGVGMILMLFRLIEAIIYHKPEVSPIPLLASSVGLWLMNILVFTLTYWEMDRGGPSMRVASAKRPDFVFAKSVSSKVPASDSRPTFVDYLFLAFTASTAFGPTDTLTITSRAKILMMLQVLISLVTIVIVGARAIGTLQ